MVMMMSQATTFVDRFVQWSVLVIRLRYQGTCIAPSTIVASFFVPLLPLRPKNKIKEFDHYHQVFDDSNNGGDFEGILAEVDNRSLHPFWALQYHGEECKQNDSGLAGRKKSLHCVKTVQSTTMAWNQ
jgi:hypothetical protein